MKPRRYLQIAKELVKDPGLGFALSGIFMFGATSTVGLMGCVSAAVVAGTARVLDLANPPFMQKSNAFSRLVKDERTTLRIMGLSMLTVMGAVLAQNAADLWMASSSLQQFISQGWISTIMPAVASAAYAITNFGFAADIGANQRRQRGEKVPPPDTSTFKAKLKLAARRPETYFAIGAVASGLMAGGWSLLGFPLAVSGYGIAMRNIIKERPSYDGHSNIHFVVMSGVLAAVSLAAQKPLLAISYLFDVVYLSRVEVLVTPGGLGRIMRDMKEGLGKKKAAPAKGTVFALQERHEPSSALPSANTLRQSFVPSPDKKPQETAPLAPSQSHEMNRN